jgi:hypothetical protein
MASIFLSYDHSDELLGGQIRGLLSKAGIRCWYDRVDLQPGASFIGGIEAAIKEFDYLGVVLSRASVNSPWVKAEVDLALTYELESGQVRLIGVRADDCEPSGFLRVKHNFDLRPDLREGVARVAEFLKGETPDISHPQQMVLAQTVEDADDKLWTQIKRGGDRSIRRETMANVLRLMSADEFMAAVAISTRWDGNKHHRSSLTSWIRREAEVDKFTADRLLDRLETLGFLKPARDLDYSRSHDPAYERGGMLGPLRNATARSGLLGHGAVPTSTNAGKHR